jgi:spermidine synthase
MIKWILFSTGFIAMAMEVVWTRAFTPVLKTQVYSFAAIVFTYLGATFIGSWWYRRGGRGVQPTSWHLLIPVLAFTAFLPAVLNSPSIVRESHLLGVPDGLSVFVLLGSIVPFCALLGYLTPGLVDEIAGGNPAQAGQAYALNVLGCILGPLVACYVLLPQVSERFALVILSLPFLFFCFQLRRRFSRLLNRTWPVVLGLTLAWSVLGTEDFEGRLHRRYDAITRRDYTATVLSFIQDRQPRLLVNGIGMTMLTPVTKFMVHLPLAFHAGPSETALVICFGMGTSYRSAMSWNLDATAVELVPSVTRAFGFYYADAARFVQATNGHIITDDGRRFLNRTANKYDVIVVDPPPPVEAAGSSLLYSRDFYELAKQHLKPGGILQMWYPGTPYEDTCQAAIRSMWESFPYLRCFPSVQGWGVHMLGSMAPIPTLNADTLAARMPESARRDLLEWEYQADAPTYLSRVLKHEYLVSDCLNSNTAVQVTDDAPYNEYYLLRRLLRQKEK